MTPKQIIEAMVIIAEAAVAEHTNRNSDYGGMSMNRAKEDAIKLLRGPGGSDITQAIHGFTDDEVTIEHKRLIALTDNVTDENHKLNQRIDGLIEANRQLKQKCLELEVENKKLKIDYCGF